MNNVHLILTCYNIKNTTSPWYLQGNNTGIGNILFQISSGLAYSNKNNATLRVPSLETYFKLEKLKKEDTIFRNINTELLPEYNEKNILKSERNNESIYNYEFQNNIILQSYFENYSNFDNYKEKLLEIFGPNEKDIKYILNKYPDIKNDNVCSLNIRMGNDFKKMFSEEIIINQKNDYFKMIDYMIEKKKINVFYVMTNDKQYCNEILDNNEKYKNIIFKYTNEIDFIDLWIISLIKNNIVSPSTFGWWGSYINTNIDKCIIHNKNNKRHLTYHEWIDINSF
jgi:hypothetical protein